jgi:hypothetical protein
VNNDSLDGGPDTDTCTSDPDPEVNCELPPWGQLRDLSRKIPILN